MTSSGERGGLASLVSCVPTEALTIYPAGVACVNLVQSPDTSGEKVAAVRVLFAIALVANAASVWLAVRDEFREFSRRELTVRQTRPFGAALVITTLAFFVFALAVPGGIVIGSVEWLPLFLLVGAVVVSGVAQVSGLAPLRDDPPEQKCIVGPARSGPLECSANATGTAGGREPLRLVATARDPCNIVRTGCSSSASRATRPISPSREA